MVTLQYGAGVGNTAQENSTVFSLIQMHQLPSAGSCGQQNFTPTNPPVFD